MHVYAKTFGGMTNVGLLRPWDARNLIDKLTDFEPEGPGMHFCQNQVQTLGKGEGGLP